MSCKKSNIPGRTRGNWMMSERDAFLPSHKNGADSHSYASREDFCRYNSVCALGCFIQLCDCEDSGELHSDQSKKGCNKIARENALEDLPEREKRYATKDP